MLYTTSLLFFAPPPQFRIPPIFEHSYFFCGSSSATSWLLGTWSQRGFSIPIATTTALLRYDTLLTGFGKYTVNWCSECLTQTDYLTPFYFKIWNCLLKLYNSFTINCRCYVWYAYSFLTRKNCPCSRNVLWRQFGKTLPLHSLLLFAVNSKLAKSS